MVVRANTYTPVAKELKRAVSRQKKGLDSIYLICGQEGLGKSEEALDNMEYVERIKSAQYDIGHVPFSIAETLANLDNFKPGDVIVIDECPELKSVNTSNELIKDFTDIVTRFRARMHIVFICFPNPFRVNAYISEDRIRGVFLVYRTGRVCYFDARTFSKIKRIETKESKDYHILLDNIVKAKFNASYPKYEGRLKEAYLAKKAENIEVKISRVANKYRDKEYMNSLLEISDVAAAHGINYNTLRDMVRYNGEEMGFKKIGTRWLMTQEQAKAFMSKWDEYHKKYTKSRQAASI